MINNRVDLVNYIMCDALANGILSQRDYFLKLLYGNIGARVFRYLKALRKYEYAINTGSNMMYWRRFYLRRLGNKYAITIIPNTVGEGIFIPHIEGGIVINCRRMGKFCTIGYGVLVGSKDSQENVATIGDNVKLYTGCKVIGNVTIGNNVEVAPNAVVVKDVPDNAIVGGIIIISYLIFHKYPGLFSYSDDIAGSGYHGFFNYLLGIINEDKFRPCWYFAEPSYSGFFLGFNFLMALRREYSSKKRRFIEYAVLLGGIFCTGSTGTFVYLILSMGVWFAYKSRIKTSIIEIILYCSLIFSIQVLPTIDTFSYFSAAVERSEASFLSRQNRYNIANEVKKDMTMTDLLVGKGPEYVTVKYKEGLSDAYNKMYCEFGILFLIVFLLYVRRLTRKNLPVYCFSLMSYLSIVIFITPIILLCYQCVNWGEELLPQKNSQS